MQKRQQENTKVVLPVKYCENNKCIEPLYANQNMNHSNRKGAFFHPKNADLFLISRRIHMLWVLTSEALLMSTHNICIRREIRKILCGYPLLSVAMMNSGSTVCLSLAICVTNHHGLESQSRYTFKGVSSVTLRKHAYIENFTTTK